MKKLLVIAFLIFISIVACTNRDGEIIDLINSVKKQNDDLKTQITALKKTTDSALVAVLKVSSLQATSEKKIDLIQTDLKIILTQISSLTTQMTAANADLASLKIKIDALQAKCAELVAQIALLNGSNNLISNPSGSGMTFSNMPTSLKNKLAVLYPFSGNANDLSGNNNNGELRGTTLSIDRFGNENSAYTFFQNQSIYIKNPLTIGFEDFTISAWVKLARYFGRWGILTWGGVDTYQGGYFYINYDGNIKFDLSNNEGPNSTAKISIDKWTHVVVTSDLGRIQLYIDGVAMTTKIPMNVSINGTMREIGVGFLGQIDDFAFWKRALNNEEIKAVYQLK
jgi:hypothetical protein